MLGDFFMKESFKKLFSILLSVLIALPMIDFDPNIKATGNATKIVFVGEKECGKTELINKLTGDTSTTHDNKNTPRKVTVDLQDFEIHELDLNLGKKTNQNESEIYTDAKIAVICITHNYDSKNIENYLKKVTENIKDKNCKLLVCMTKCDNDKNNVDYNLKNNIKDAIKKDYTINDGISKIKFEDKIIYTSAKKNIRISDLKDKIFGKKSIYNNYNSNFNSGVDLDFGSIICLLSLVYLGCEVVRICFFNNKPKSQEQKINTIKNKKKTNSKIHKNKVRC